MSVTFGSVTSLLRFFAAFFSLAQMLLELGPELSISSNCFSVRSSSGFELGDILDLFRPTLIWSRFPALSS